MAEVHDRIMDNLRVRVPGAVDDGINLEVFNTVDDLCRNALYITAPTSFTSGNTTWLTEAQYKQHYRLIIDGTAYRLLMQANKPWSNPDLAKVHFIAFQEAMAQARIDQGNDTSDTDITDRIMDELRMELPGAKDAQIQLILGSVVDEMCRTADIYPASIEILLVAGTNTYVGISPTGQNIVRIYNLDHGTIDTGGATYDVYSDTLSLATVPTSADTGELLVALASVTPRLAVQTWTNWLTTELWELHYQALIDGTCGRMMLQLAKPYSNPAMGRVRRQSFRNRMALARSQTVSGAAPDAQMWSFPRHTQ